MPKSYCLTNQEMDEVLAKLQEKYVIYAPVRIKNGGRYALDDTIMYKEVTQFNDIEFKERSIFPMKDALIPMTQTLFHFTEDEFREAKLKDERDLLILGRACDLNAVRIMDEIYLENGGIEDFFYKRMREKAHFVLIECTSQYDGCFCCSVGSNETELHDFAISFRDEAAYINTQANEFADYFEGYQTADYEISFPQENDEKVTVPVIANKAELNALKAHPMWDEFDARCIECGKCTITCSTCTCFTTTDILYNENSRIGERKRTCASCMVDGFDEMAGGHKFREATKDRYRYKILHKIYGHNLRFGTGPMCVGCGRCDADCPQLIGYTASINKVAKALEDIRQEGK